MKQVSRNYFLENFANILSLATPSKFPKICDFCGELFEANMMKSSVRCSVCYSLYYVAYNDLNDFWYLEFAESPEDYVS